MLKIFIIIGIELNSIIIKFITKNFLFSITRNVLLSQLKLCAVKNIQLLLAIIGFPTLCLYSTEFFRGISEIFQLKSEIFQKFRNMSAIILKQLWNSKMFAILTLETYRKIAKRLQKKTCNFSKILSKRFLK